MEVQNTEDTREAIMHVCPCCRRDLNVAVCGLACSSCGSLYSEYCGILDFRNGFEETEHQLALAERFYRDWNVLSYEDMVRERYAGLRERGIKAGKDPATFRWMNADEAAHLGSYRVRGEYHCRILINMLHSLGADTHVTRLIDIGCGWGRDLLHLAKIADKVIGIDVSTFSLLMTRKLMEENEQYNVRVLLAQGEHLPLPDGWADAMNSSATIEHFPSPELFLEEASRCLRPGGWLFLYYPNRYSLLQETHTGIWGLGWLPCKMQERVVNRKSGGASTWNVTLFSRASFYRILRAHFDVAEVRISGLPVGMEDMLSASKFGEMLRPTVSGVRRMIRLCRRLPGLEHLLGTFSPVHYVLCVRR